MEGKCGGEILAMVLGTYGNSSRETDESGVSVSFLLREQSRKQSRVTVPAFWVGLPFFLH